MALDDTPGGADANTYCSEEDCDAYHEGRLYTDTWDDADDDNREKALRMATRLLDQWFEWDGIVATAEQALLWPRIGAIGASGHLLPSDEIPVAIREATAELARQLLDADRSADSDVETQGLKRIMAGSVELEFTGAASAKVIPDAVVGFVGRLGRQRGRSGGAVNLYRG